MQEWRCPQCGAPFREIEEQFSISMWRTFALRTDRAKPVVVGMYLIGFRAFSGFNLGRVSDFAQSPSVPSYVDGITGAT